MNSLLSAIKAFVLKSRPAYKDYLGNGKYDVKKLPEECVPDSVNDNIKNAKNKADSAYDKADSAYDEASSAYSMANLAYDKASDINSRLFTLTNLNYNFKTFEHTVAKEPNIRTGVTDTNGISDIPLAESTAPMQCHFNIVLNDSSNNRIGGYKVFDGKIVRGITKISETYRSFIDERVKLGSDGYAELKIGYWLNSNDNLWHKDIGVVISLPSTDIDNSNISTVFIEAYGDLVDVNNYAPWPSICVPLAGTNDAGVVYASDKTDDQTVPVSIDKNGYLWCKGSETLPKDGNPGDILVKTETGSVWQKQEPATSTDDAAQSAASNTKPIVIEAEANASNGTVNLTADGISKMNTLDSRYENGNPCPAYLHYAVNGENVYSALIFSQFGNYYFRNDYTVSIYVVPDTENGWKLITEPKT